MLTPDELAYMAATQEDAQPQQAVLLGRVVADDSTGGQVDTWPGEGVPVSVRVDVSPDRVPAVVGAQVDDASVVKLTMPRDVEVRAGDHVRVNSDEVYQVVTEGDPGAWTTAQAVWAQRIAWPGRIT